MIDTIKIGNLKWHHIANTSDENINYIEEHFDFHPLDLEDCKSKSQRSKIDIYDNYNFLILHFPYFDIVNKFIRTKEVKIFWGKDYIITIGKSHWVIKTFFDEIKEKIDNNVENENIPNTSDLLLYNILEHLMKETNKLLQKVDNSLERINRELFNILRCPIKYL